MNRCDAPAPRLFDVLRNVPGTISVTLVGSFVDRQHPATISDIDTVVVFDRLTPSRFSMAVAAVAALSGGDVGFPGRRVRVNATLGPLKFDDPDQVVVHLMPYDLESHREHVLKSPFTCFDWERSACFSGKSLEQIYPVGRIQPGDFLSARRGLANYVDDLESGALSYRRLEPRDDRIVEVADRMALDRRHVGEYAYHIIRNLIVNALKLRTGSNGYWDDLMLPEAWRRELAALADWIPLYECLRAVKHARSSAFPADTLSKTRAFIDAFAASLQWDLAQAFHLQLVRHARTGLNDGTFLGRWRDPPIVERPQPAPERFDVAYASRLRRAVETAEALAPDVPVQIDDRLCEIDYGMVEGLTAAEAREAHPELRAAWDSGLDVPFPGGEGTADVLTRARAFLASRPAGPAHALAVTHNVVLRAVAADLLGLDLVRAYKIPVGHLEPLRVCRIGGRWMPDFDSATKAKLIDGYVGWTDV
jgi:broad specificity phosphatase PhoE